MKIKDSGINSIRIVAYNIFRGGEDEDKSRMPLIEQVIKDIAPTVIATQEVVNFDKEDYAKLKQFISKVGLPNWEHSKGILRPSGRSFDVATFSTIPLKKISDFNQTMRNGALNVVIDTVFGEISICNVHLTPGTEDERMIEIKKAIESQSPVHNKIILGDLNSLARVDNYSPDFISKFNESQKKKFLTEGKTRYDVTDTLLKLGYIDLAAELNCKENTVPTASNVDVAHECPLRLDYIFISKPLLKHVLGFGVVKTDYSEKASDHYPLVLSLGE